MGVIIRQSIRSSIVSYLGIIIGAFNILWLYPKFLKPEEFGLIRLLQDIPLLFALFVQLGASSIIDRFFHHFKDEKKSKDFNTLLFLYPLIGFSLFLVTFFGFNEFWQSLFEAKSSLLLDYFIYLAPLTFFMMYTAIMEAYLRANLKISWSNFVRDVLIRIFYTLFVIVYAFKLVSFNGLTFLILVGYGVSLFTLILYSKKINILQFSNKLSLPSKDLQKQIGVYLLFLLPGTAGSLIAQKIDTIMLATISGLKENEGLQNIAIYSMAYFISSVIEVPRKSISQISVPLLSSAFKNEDYPQILTLYKKNSLTQYLAGIFIFLLIWMNIDLLFLFVPNAAIYQQGKYVILLIGISKLFDMATSINSEIIQFSKYYKFNLVAILFLSVLTILFNLVFIPLYSIHGAAIALALTIFLYNLLKTYYIWKTMKILPFSKGMIFLTVLCMTIIGLTILYPLNTSSLRNALLFGSLQSSVFCLIYYLTIRKLKISEDLNKVIDQTLVQWAKKLNSPWLTKL